MLSGQILYLMEKYRALELIETENYMYQVLEKYVACHPPKTLDIRPRTGRRQVAVVIFLFGLEALWTRDSRVPFICCLFLPQTTGCCWLLQWSNPVSIGSHSDQTSFQFSSLYLWALGKHCFVKMSSSTFCCTVFLFNVFGPPPPHRPEQCSQSPTLFAHLLELNASMSE